MLASDHIDVHSRPAPQAHQLICMKRFAKAAFVETHLCVNTPSWSVMSLALSIEGFLLKVADSPGQLIETPTATTKCQYLVPWE